MQRVVIDPGVIVRPAVSGRTSRSHPRRLAGRKLEAVVSEHLLGELVDVLRRPKFRGLINPEEVGALDDELRRVCDVAIDPPDPDPVARDRTTTT